TWADNDTPMSLAHFTEDAVYIEPPDLQRYKGHIELRLFFNDLEVGSMMKWHNLWFDEAAQRGAGEYSFSLGGWENKANHGVAVVEMRDGKIAVWREYQRRGVASFESFVGGDEGEKKQAAIAAIGAGMTPMLSNEKLQRGVHKLRDFLEGIPAVSEVATSDAAEHEWWVKFSIDIESPIAWHVVQELGHILNYISMDERLPTLFMPVSPPPYVNGGPGEFLSWVIEARGPGVDAWEITKVLEERLPDPIDEVNAWLEEE
ncbi:MAG: hypothetical protein ABIQ44_00260, partial [Chloroflexia bacterium]